MSLRHPVFSVVFKSLYGYTQIYTCTHRHLHTLTHTHTHTSTYIIYIYTYTCVMGARSIILSCTSTIHIYMYVYICIYVYIYIYTHTFLIYICTYVYTYLHTYTCTSYSCKKHFFSSLLLFSNKLHLLYIDIHVSNYTLYLEMYIYGVAATRVPGLSIRDCARGCNNRAQMCPQLSAIDVTAKTFFERLCLVLGLRKIAPWVNCLYAPTTSTIHFTTISRFLCNCFPRMAPQFFLSSWFTK